jgi:hypothetical protein
MAVEPSSIVAMLKLIHLFRGVDETKLDSAVGLMDIIEKPAGEVVYNQGDDPDYFYFIYSGRVRITRQYSRSNPPVQLGYVEEGDYFGHEILEADWSRQVTAETITEVILLRLDVPRFKVLLDIVPILAQRLQFILDSYRLMITKQFNWHGPEEYFYLVARRHVLFMWLHILFPTLFGVTVPPVLLFFTIGSGFSVTLLSLFILATIITLGWWIWAHVDWANDYYIITNRRIIFQERVVLLYDSRQESPNEAIQSTSTNTSQVGRILGYGNVSIRTYIGTILFRDISNPEQVMAMIQEQQVRAQTSQRRAEIRAMETTLERRIGMTQTPIQPPKPGPEPAKPSALQKFLSDLLHMRYEVGGTILYRTHWFILLGKVWLPLTLIIGLIVVVSLGTVSNLPLYAICGVSGLLGFFLFLWFGYQYWDWHNDIYLITPDQIVDVNKKPLGHEERRAAPIKNILSIEYQRLGILGLLLNFGTVQIRVGDQQLTFDNVYNPSEVQRELFHRLAAKNYAEKQTQAENERQRLADWIAAYHRVTHRNQPPSNPPARSGF